MPCVRGFEPICRAHDTSTIVCTPLMGCCEAPSCWLLEVETGCVDGRARRQPCSVLPEAACPELSRSRLTTRVPVRAGRDVDPNQIPGPRASAGTLGSHHLAGPISRGYGLCAADVGVPRARRAYRTTGRWDGLCGFFVRPHDW